MIIYSSKTDRYYRLTPMIVTGATKKARQAILDCGFSEEVIQADSLPARSQKAFILYETAPQNTSLEICFWRDLKKTVEMKRMNTAKPSSRPIAPVAPDFPSFFRQIKNLAETLSGFARDGFRLADEGEWRRRFEICRACPSFFGNRCTQCGCFSEVKSRINAANCPDGKW